MSRSTTTSTFPVTADLEVKCGELSFLIAKECLCAQSTYLKKLLDSRSEESNDNILELPHDDPILINLLITFLKTGNYNPNETPSLPPSPSTSSSTQPNDEESTTRKRRRTTTTTTTHPSKSFGDKLNRSLSSQLTNIRIYALASKYTIPNLQRFSLRKFTSIPFDTYLHGTEDVVKEIYTTTPSSDRLLKDAIVSILAEQLWDPYRFDGAEGGEGPTTEELLECVASTPEAMKDLLKEATKKMKTVSEGWRWERQARWDMWKEVEKTGRCCDVCGEGGGVKVDVRRCDFEMGKVEVCCVICGGVLEDEWGESAGSGSDRTMEDEDDDGVE